MKDEDKSKKDLIKEVKKLRKQVRSLKNINDESSAENEESLKAAVDGLDGLLYICTSDNRVTYLNENFKSLIGSDITGELCYESIFGFETPCPWCALEEVLNGNTVRTEFQHPKNKAWYYFVNSPIKNSKGETFIQGFALDITPYKEKERKLEEYKDKLEEIIKERTGGLIAMNEMLKKEISERKEQEKELRFKDLAIKSTVNAILFADLNGVITYGNDFFSIMWGFEHEEDIVGGNFKDLWASLKNSETLLALLQDKGNWMGEIQAKRTDDSTFYALVSATIVKDIHSDESRIMCSIVDITDRIRAEKAILDSEERIRKVIQDMPILMDAFDENGQIIVWNKECERVTGYTSEDIINSSSVIELLYPDEKYRNYLMSMWEERGNYFRDWEMKLTCKDGSERIVSWSNISKNSPIPGWNSWAVGIDVTERKRLEREILDISEKERINVGHDLHDGIGQYFIGMGYLTSMLKNRLNEQSNDDTAVVDELLNIIDEAKAHIRNLSKGLSPVNMDRYGFSIAVKDLCMNTEKFFNIICRFIYDNDVIIENNSISTHIYYIIQESINNAVKHGKAKNIEVEMKKSDTEILIIVDDNGKGFIEDIDNKKGIGIDLMNYRADIIGASLEFNSSKLGGVNMTLRINDYILK